MSTGLVAGPRKDRLVCRHRKDRESFVAFCRNSHGASARRRRRSFFLAAAQGDNHRTRITEDATNRGQRHESWEPIEVVEQLENCHRQSMTGFSNEEKKEFPANYAVATASLVKTDPLKNAMNLKKFVIPFMF